MNLRVSKEGGDGKSWKKERERKGLCNYILI